MKLEKQGTVTPGDKPSTVAIPHALTLLSPVRIASMSERELQEVLPQLVNILQQGLMSKRPDWWPHSTIPWTLQNLSRAVKSANPTSLRTLVQKCYNYLTQHSPKPAPAQSQIQTQPRVLDWLNSNPPSRSCTQPGKTNGISNPKQKGAVPYLEIYLCYQCNHEFSTKDALQKHQVQCSGGTLPLSIPSTPPASEAPSPAAPTIVSDDASSSGGNSNSTHLSSLSTVSYRDFVTILDLVPVHRARKIRQARRRNTECETIDLEEPQTPISPPTPRTPKLLISQLSRDASTSGTGGNGSQGVASRRRLSYMRQSLDKKPEKSAGEEKEEELDSDSDEESTESGTDDSDEPKLHRKSLFSIDVASALGQRVLKHMTAEVNVPVISDVEQFCRTPIKDKYQDRLRFRQLSYPITWKLTRKRLRLQAHCHMYNFTRAQKFEFMEKMRTGLNFHCRKLLRCVKRCSVVVKRLSMKTLYKWKPSLNKISVPLTPLTKKEIQFWTRPKPVSAQPSVFPDGPTFLLTDIDRVLGLKRKDGSPEVASKLLVSHCVSETANAELQQQKLTVYRSLLTDLSSSVASERGQKSGSVSAAARKERMSEKEKSYPTLYSILSGVSPRFKSPKKCKESSEVSEDIKKPLKIDIPSPSVTRSNRSSPLDDSFSIMTVSSDEDNSKSAACCALCAVRSKCKCSPKKAVSTSTSQSAPSPAFASMLSSPSVASPVPPSLASPIVVSKDSPSSQLTLSPPDLSPISTESCPKSPGLRLSPRRSAVSPKTPTHLRSSNLPESPLARGHVSRSLPSGSSGKMEESKRNSRETTRQGQKGAALQVSADLFQPLLTGQKPQTRSSSKESTTSEPTAVHSSCKTVSVLAESKNKSIKESLADLKSVAPNTAPKMAVVHTASKAESRLTRSSTQTSEKNSSASQETSAVGVDQSSRQPRHRQSGQVNSNSSDRNQKSEERKNMSGQHSRSNSNSSDRNQKSVKKTSALPDGESRTLRSGNLVHKVQPHTECSASNKSINSVHTEAASNSLSTRRSLRGNPFANADGEKEMEKSSESVQVRTMKRSATETTAAQSRTLNGSLDSSPSKSTNPFLISKVQTPLFSSSVLERARRHWNPPHKSSTRSSKAVLRSGNTFRMSNIALDLQGRSFGPETGSNMWRVETPAQSVRPWESDGEHKVSDPKSPVIEPGSPDQRAPLSPTRKRLSPMQMLSVLESTKGRRPTSKVKSPVASPSRSKTKQKFDQAVTRLTGIKPGYHTRAKEYVSPAKKARLAD